MPAVMHRADHGKAELGVQPDRRLVFAVTDDADHLFVSEVAAAVDEFSEKRGSDSEVPCGLCHIDGILDRGVVGLSFTERSA